jgi:hypothetical protein
MRIPHLLPILCILSGPLGLFLVPSLARATDLRVNLFGQPCVLQGPVDAKSLKAIHSLSPEQIYPSRDGPLATDPTRQALDRLKTSTIPTALEPYRERLTKRLQAQLALLEAIDSYRKIKKPAPLLEAAGTFLKGKRLKEFEVLAKKGDIESAFDLFSDGIEAADPEEEFHRAIGRMKVQYTCSFDAEGKQ